MRRFIVLICLAIVTAACGGDDGADTYVSTLEAIGANQRESSSQIVGGSTTAPTLAQIEALRELRASALDQVAELEPPEQLAGRHARFVATLATVVAALDLLIDTVTRTGDESLILAPADVIAAQQAFDAECEALEDEAADLVGRPVDLAC